MIPSVLSTQVRKGIEEFLLTTFPVTTPLFARSLPDLLATEGSVFRGPYLSLKLPFRVGEKGNGYFPGVLPEGFRPHRHQERAFERLGGSERLSTLLATGTGSGKTECFLYPVLDHCAREVGRPGVKAIVVYPMNALATDQAKRFAKAIAASPALKGKVTAGLYVGGIGREKQTAMGPENVITDREAMRSAPPDILLTNYKMLDYLLLRPDDARLWRENGPETLRFLVVDELHTFDGAQGADLACLIRRLKARLKTPERHLCCIGTSATLGEGPELYFAGEYASAGDGEGKACFLEASRVADECLALLRARASEGSARDWGRATPVDLVPRLAGDPDAASAFEWGGVAWGMYALAEGIFAAARQGAAARIRDFAEAVIRLAPAIDDAAGDRTLGRLHHKTPSIPLVTGWISGKEAVRHLRRASTVAPTSLVNRLFLAEALHDLDASRRDEAVSIAEGVVRDAPDPKWVVEHERARADAKELLRLWRASGS